MTDTSKLVSVVIAGLGSRSDLSGSIPLLHAAFFELSNEYPQYFRGLSFQDRGFGKYSPELDCILDTLYVCDFFDFFFDERLIVSDRLVKKAETLFDSSLQKEVRAMSGKLEKALGEGKS